MVQTNTREDFIKSISGTYTLREAIEIERELNKYPTPIRVDKAHSKLNWVDAKTGNKVVIGSNK
jgi:hypothetical protein